MPVSSSADPTPIDVVITWVDGGDSKFSEKLEYHLNGKSRSVVPGANHTRFASVNEITYCVLSILTFAPFVRKIFIVTDNQNPKIFDVVKKFFPERLKSISIVDHTEIFNGYEEFLPTFNSRSIETMIWRIKGLSNNFVYFNDDNFLVRPIEPNDWFINSKPVLRGKWFPAPTPRLLWDWTMQCLQRHVLHKTHFKPRPSFHIGQWNAARIAGYTFKYFANSHTPHPIDLVTVSGFLDRDKTILKENIRYKFRNQKQFNFVSLSNHLQLSHGNRYIAKPDLAYLQPVGRAKGYIDKKMAYCIKNQHVKFICVQSLDLCNHTERNKLYSWMDSILQLEVDSKQWLQPEQK
ncbi:MAG: Stealth CR1 domain-containing protein [Bacteroidales bacterium]